MTYVEFRRLCVEAVVNGAGPRLLYTRFDGSTDGRWLIHASVIRSVAEQHHVPMREAQPTGDWTDYARKPFCVILEDRVLRVVQADRYWS